MVHPAAGQHGTDAWGDGVDAALAAVKSGGRKLASTVIDALDPPTPLVAAVFDGTTDDSVALQAMLDSITTTGGTVRTPEGRTACCNLVMTGIGGSNLVGGGLGSILKPYDKTKPVLSIGDGSTDTRRITVKNLRFEGDGTTNTSDGLVINGAQNSDFSNITIHNFGRDGMHVTSGTLPTEYLTFSHIYIDICKGTGLAIDYGASWTTALYAYGLFILGNSNAGAKALTIGASVILSVQGGWIQTPGSALGHTVLAATARILGEALTFDSNNQPTDVLVSITGVKPFASWCLRGSITVNGLIKYDDATTVAGYIGTGRYVWPILTDVLFTDSATARNLQDSVTQTTGGIVLSNIAGQLTLFPTGLYNSDPGQIIFRGKTGTPASATDTGKVGQIMWDATYIYFCIGTNTWIRIARAW